MPKLIGIDRTSSYSWVLTPGRQVIGRSADCDCYVPDSAVSRKHAELEVSSLGGDLYITDLGSHNGTTVNGAKITTRTIVRPGDCITVGCVELKIVSDTDDTTTGLTQALELTEDEPANSSLMSMEEALKPLPSRVSGIPGLLPTLFDMASFLMLPEPQEQMLKKALAMIAKVIPAERLAVLFVSDKGDQVSTAAVLLPEYKDLGVFTLSKTILKELLTNKNAILIGNPQEDPHFARQESIVQAAFKSAMAVPLFDEDRVMGILYVDTTNSMHRYTQEYLRLLAIFGNIIASRLINFALLCERDEKRAMDEELRRAAMIQKNLLVKAVPELPGYQLHAFQEQSHSVGGDMYDFSLLPDGRLLLLVGDVSGKGMGAALLMSNIMASFRILYHGASFNLSQAVRQVSMQLWRHSAPEQYATLFICLVDGPRGLIRYVNAGHNPPLLVRQSGEIDRLGPTGIPIGAFDGDPWTEAIQQISIGDVLFVFTDGITEAVKGEQLYSDSRMEQLIVTSRHLEPELIAARLLEDIDSFVDDSPRSDDITMVIMKRKSTR